MTSHHCTTAGMTIVPLVPLAQFGSVACAAQPIPLAHSDSPTRLHNSVNQVTPRFSGLRETSVAVQDALILHEEIAVLLVKDATKPVPPPEMESGIYSPYFIMPKKGSGLRLILDLRVLNCSSSCSRC